MAWPNSCPSLNKNIENRYGFDPLWHKGRRGCLVCLELSRAARPSPGSLSPITWAVYQAGWDGSNSEGRLQGGMSSMVQVHISFCLNWLTLENITVIENPENVILLSIIAISSTSRNKAAKNIIAKTSCFRHPVSYHNAVNTCRHVTLLLWHFSSLVLKTCSSSVLPRIYLTFHPLTGSSLLMKNLLVWEFIPLFFSKYTT